VWATKTEIIGVGRDGSVNLPIKCVKIVPGINMMVATAMMPNLREAAIRNGEVEVRIRSLSLGFDPDPKVDEASCVADSKLKSGQQLFEVNYSPVLRMDFEPASSEETPPLSLNRQIRVGEGQMRFTTIDGDQIRVTGRWGQVEVRMGPEWVLETANKYVEMRATMVQRTNGASHGQE
jgi:hypothetical protein